jgi:hypothetical protein
MTGPITHTPGPWELGSKEHGDEYALCIVQNSSWRGQQFIARAEPFGAHEGMDEAEANARLIAAAPELLEALKAFFAAWDMLPNGVYDKEVIEHWIETELSDKVRLMRAAIAKAEGMK